MHLALSKPFPPRDAGASLKQVTLASTIIPFPRPFPPRDAGASLKRIHAATFLDVRRSHFPRVMRGPH